MPLSSYATLIDPIRARAAASPEWPGIVLIHEDGRRESVTVGELWSDMLAVAAGLRRAGMRADDVAIVIVEHSRQLLTTFLGAMVLGVVPTMVPTPPPRMEAAAYRQRIDALALRFGLEPANAFGRRLT